MTTSLVRYSLARKRVFVAGHRGMVGAALVRRLASEDCEVVVANREALDLRDQTAVLEFFKEHKPHAVILAAAKVGGILANDTYPADFLSENLAIQSAVIDAAFRCEVEKLLFLGSSCIYPKFAPQPIHEDSLLTGPLESTNEWYAIAKIAGLKLCAAYRKQHRVDYISAMPTNLYGPGDNYNLNASHVIPALLRKAHEAKLSSADSFTVWGSGTPRREFLHVDDAADAFIYLLKEYSSPQHINVGTGEDLSILDLANEVASVVGFKGVIKTDPSKPDGTPRKLLNVSSLTSLGWRPRYSLREGLAHAYACFLTSLEHGQARV